MKSLFCTILIVGLPLALSTQDFITQYRSLSVTNGLPNTSINKLFQDSRGFIWITTLNGIARYDGTQLNVYHPSYEMDSLTAVRDFPFMHESADGQLWLAYLLAKHRLFRYDYQRDTFFHYELAPLEADASIKPRAIWQSEDQKLWLSTGTQGLWVFDIAAKQDTIPYIVFQHNEQDPTSLPTNYLAPTIWQDDEKRMWILTESGLASLEYESTCFNTYTWSDIPVENEGLNFWPDTKRRCFWIGTFVGLVRFNWDDYSYQRYQLFTDDDKAEVLMIGSPIIDNKEKILFLNFFCTPSCTLKTIHKKPGIELTSSCIYICDSISVHIVLS